MFYFLFQSTSVLKASGWNALQKISGSSVILQARFHRFLRNIVQLCFFFFFLQAVSKKKSQKTTQGSKRKVYSFLLRKPSKKKVLVKVSKLPSKKKAYNSNLGTKSLVARKMREVVVKKRFIKSSKTFLLRKELLNVIKFLIEPVDSLAPFSSDSGRNTSYSNSSTAPKKGFRRYTKVNQYKAKKGISPYARYLRVLKRSLAVVVGGAKTKSRSQYRPLSFSSNSMTRLPLMAPNQIFMWRHLELNISLGIGLILPLSNLHFYSFMLDNPYLWRHLLVEYHNYFK